MEVANELPSDLDVSVEKNEGDNKMMKSIKIIPGNGKCKDLEIRDAI